MVALLGIVPQKVFDAHNGDQEKSDQMNWIETYLKTHLFYVIIIVIGLVAFRSWLSEHDARLAVDAKVKTSESIVADLRAQIVETNKSRDLAIAAVKTRVAAVKTTAQALIAIPDLSNLPLHVRPLPDAPNQVAVDAVPLAQELGACRVDRITLGACQTTVARQESIIKEDATQIAALKQKPKFWERVGDQVKSGSIFITIGIGIAKVFL